MAADSVDIPPTHEGEKTLQPLPADAASTSAAPANTTAPATARKGRPASANNKFYAEWGFETIKKSLDFTNDVLRQLVTLSSGLLGGSLAFLDARLIGATEKNIVVILIFLALVLSFCGILPVQGQIDPHHPLSVKRYKERTLSAKIFLLRASAALLAIGFIVAIYGLIAHANT